MEPDKSCIKEAICGYKLFLSLLFGASLLIVWAGIHFFYPKEYATDVIFYVLTESDTTAFCQQDFAVNEQVEGYMRLMDSKRSFDELSAYRYQLTGEKVSYQNSMSYYLNDTPYFSVKARIWEATPELSEKMTLKWIALGGEWRNEIIRNKLKQLKSQASYALDKLNKDYKTAEAKSDPFYQEKKADLLIIINNAQAKIALQDTPYEIVEVTPHEKAQKRPVALWLAFPVALAVVMLTVLILAFKKQLN